MLPKRGLLWVRKTVGGANSREGKYSRVKEEE